MSIPSFILELIDGVRNMKKKVSIPKKPVKKSNREVKTMQTQPKKDEKKSKRVPTRNWDGD